MKRPEAGVRRSAGSPRGLGAVRLDRSWRSLAGWGRERAGSLLVLFLAAVVVRVLFLAVSRSFDHDELEAVHSAWKILHGERIYVDFLNQHHPLFYYLMVPVIAILGEGSDTLISIRLLMVGMFVAILGVTYKTATMIFDRETALVGTLFLSTSLVFTEKAMQIRPDVPQALLGLGGVFFLFRYLSGKAVRDLAISGLLLGISFLFLQKVLVLIVLAEMLLLWSLYREETSLQDLFAHVVFLLFPVGAYYGYLLATGTFRSYLECCWLLNYQWNRHVSVVQNLSGSRVLFTSIQVNPVLWGAYLFGAIFFLNRSLRRRLAFLSGGLLAAAFVREPLPQDLMLAVPLVSLVSAHAVRSVLQERSHVLVAVALSVALPSLALAFGDYGDNRAQRRKVDYVLSIARRGDRVYDGDIRFNVFRRDIDFAWFSVRPGGALDAYRAVTGHSYDIYSLIDRRKPVVISDWCIPDLRDPRIADHYVRSPRYGDLFIRAR